ncbi:biopolymer transporter [Ectothiorhodospira haloalkaliphila]|uniref:Biopolymer transporter n=1 Tax=Ectothiorhodospira haloalkaliphila TaxID=421628 RepID=W8KTG7_9GAMM|nr:MULTISPECIES: biopolymer transporter ExbD [Ectothiorhodospira]AHK78886.1 biopolymer transporter [Ectothiorhodospira haloalkaliphila]MCG5493140.1 biopolymer transporter ExbD [Ectothiorhodospira variabilis]MCG5497138.1 biopolymer transporter ExbD [Ectothiorhodospira variabilis]MCG5502469.1 biopolymer transporter ExbD [Ectothiorhodospira variabilis]MCG5505765.1 biopolymer transporter ExbD [Ectothiorhodospira variabilis]
MNFRRRQTEEVGVNLTPLIDVVFLLLIFFMVSTTFDRHSVLQLELPRADATEEQALPRTVELVINAEGRFFLDGAELVNTRPETLRAALGEVIGDDQETPLVIRADARTPHQSVVTAMNVAQRLGLSRLSIATLGGESE